MPTSCAQDSHRVAGKERWRTNKIYSRWPEWVQHASVARAKSPKARLGQLCWYHLSLSMRGSCSCQCCPHANGARGRAGCWMGAASLPACASGRMDVSSGRAAAAFKSTTRRSPHGFRSSHTNPCGPRVHPLRPLDSSKKQPIRPCDRATMTYFAPCTPHGALGGRGGTTGSLCPRDPASQRVDDG